MNALFDYILLTLTSYSSQRTNVQLFITANSSSQLTNIYWGNNVGVININYSRGYQASAHAIITLTNTGNVPVNFYLKMVSYRIAIPQTTITAFWEMSSDVGLNITLQPGQIVHPSLTITIVSNTPAYGTTPFNVHIQRSRNYNGNPSNRLNLENLFSFFFDKTKWGALKFRHRLFLLSGRNV